METLDVHIKELSIDMIQPTTNNYMSPDSYGSKIVVIGKPGCFTAGTRILMYDGSKKKVEDVKIGDQVMGDDSTPRNVLELCRNEDEMFDIVLEKGNIYKVNLKHKLVVRMNDQISEITVEDFIKLPEHDKHSATVMKASVVFRETPVGKNPYDIGYSGIAIPNAYIVNSMDTRMSVIAGIFDRSEYDISNETVSVLSDDPCEIHNLAFLFRSVGLRVSRSVVSVIRKIKQTTPERTTNEFLGKLTVFLNDSVSIPCRKHTIENILREQSLEYIFNVVPVGVGQYYGFTIDGNHRFLLGTLDVVRNTGKSTLIASLLYAKKHIFPVGVAFSGTEDSNGFFRKIMPSSFVFNEYSPDKIELFIKRQKIAKRHIENPWAVIVIDDCTDDPRILATPLQQGIFKRSRHWKQLYILSLQYSMDIKPVIRTNVDGTFILREPSLKNRKSLWENYASIIPDFNLFCQILDKCTDDYCSLFISNMTRSNNWQDCVFFYRAPLIPDGFKFGCPEYWDFHNDRYNESYVDPFDT